MTHQQLRKIRPLFTDHLNKTPDALWQPYERKVSGVVISGVSIDTSVMHVCFTKEPNENLLLVSYCEFLAANNIRETDYNS